MIRLSKIVYTLEPYTDNSPEAMQAAFTDYVEFLSRLSAESVIKFNSIMLIVGSAILNKVKEANDDLEAYRKELYRSDTTSFLSSHEDSKEIRLIERVIYQDDDTECFSGEINNYGLDNKIIKALLLIYIYKFEIIGEDRDVIIAHFGLNEYVGKVNAAEVVDREHADYVLKYNEFLYEFYSRSNAAVKSDLGRFLRKSTMYFLSDYAVKKFNNDIDFEFKLPRNISKDAALSLIDDYSNSMKKYVERMYEHNYTEDAYKAVSGKGRRHYSTQFRKWDRYLRIYDLYLEYEKKGWKITTYRLNTIGKLIVEEFKVFAKYADTDLRKEVVKGYTEALRLIELSKTGVLF